MKKKYFHRSTVWLTAAIALYFLHDSYELLILLIDGASALWLHLIELVQNLVLSAICILFILYVRQVNSKGLMHRGAAQKFMWISTLFLAAGSCAIITDRFFKTDDSLTFAVFILFSTVAYQIYRLTNEAATAKEENDLTV